jgi:hypothetical protein
VRCGEKKTEDRSPKHGRVVKFFDLRTGNDDFWFKNTGILLKALGKMLALQQ